MAPQSMSQGDYNRSLPGTLQVPNSEAARSQTCYYRPKVSKEECEVLLRGKPLGTFIARDSSTFVGGFCIMMRLQENGSTVTRSYLLEKVSNGIHLRLTDERVFPTLYDFIYGHTTDKLVLPDRLVLPSDDWMSKLDPALASKILIKDSGVVVQSSPLPDRPPKPGAEQPALPPSLPPKVDSLTTVTQKTAPRLPPKTDGGKPALPRLPDGGPPKPALPPHPDGGSTKSGVPRLPPKAQGPPLPQKPDDPPLPQKPEGPPLPQKPEGPPLPQKPEGPPLPQKTEGPPVPSAPRIPPKSESTSRSDSHSDSVQSTYDTVQEELKSPAPEVQKSPRTSLATDVDVDEVECELYYYGCMDTWAEGHKECIFQTYLELIEIRSVVPNKIIFKMAGQSIHIEDKGDKGSKQFIRRHYPIRSLLHFDLDPDQRTAKVKKEKKPLSVFGMVIRKPGQDKNICHLFAAQHVSASGVIDAVQAGIELIASQMQS